MKKTFLRLFSCIMALVLLAAAMTLCLSSCRNGQTESTSAGTTDTTTANQPEAATTIGQGKTTFTFTVTFPDKTTKSYAVSTDADTVGRALLDAGLIAGEEGAYGLYVKTVDGQTLDYNQDGKYWAFYIDGEYAMTGVDATPVADGHSYAFVAE